MTNSETKLKQRFPDPMTLPVHFSNIRSSTPTAFSNNKIYRKQAWSPKQKQQLVRKKKLKSADDWPHIGD